MTTRIIALAISIYAFSTSIVSAEVIVVSTIADSGKHSLRNSVALAKEGETIQFAPALYGQTITLTSGEIIIDKDIVIEGPGPNRLTVKRSAAPDTPAFRIFQITPAHTVSIQGLTISNGLVENGLPADSGGAIYNDGSTLTVTNCVISGNSAISGGGILNDASHSANAVLTITDSSLSNNIVESGGRGGGIFNYAPQAPSKAVATITNCKFTGNRGGFGGAVSNRGDGDAKVSANATATIANSTISGNFANYDGAGIHNESGIFGSATLMVSNSTIDGNTAAQNCGGICNIERGSVATIANCTISNNSAHPTSGGIGNASGTLTITNSTISRNVANGSQGYGGGINNYQGTLTIDHCTFNGNSVTEIGDSIFNDTNGSVSVANTIFRAGTGVNIVNLPGAQFISRGYNLSSDDGSGFFIANGDQINADPKLAPLHNNGGPTLTHGLLAGSPAINGGDPNFTPPPDYDQRGQGFPRVLAGRTDIGSFEGQIVVPTPAPTRLLNISTRVRVLAGNEVLIGGFIVTGNAPKKVIVRAVGPSLTNLGVPGALADPVLEFNGMTNDNWRDTQESEIEASGVGPISDLESAIVATLSPGAYTAIVRGNNGGTGVGLVEAYDLDSMADSNLANISTRGFVDTGDYASIGGFILGNGSGDGRVLIRAIGPSLTATGISGALEDPKLELYNSSGQMIDDNDDWKDFQQAEIEATGIPPGDDREAAIVRTIAPDAYTAIVRGQDGGTGVALVEIYQLTGPTPTPTPGPTSTPTPTPSPTPVVTPTPGGGPATFGSLSSSAMVGIDDAILLNAFIVTGAIPKQLILRGLGPSLGGTTNVLADPMIELRGSDGALIGANDNWKSDQEAEIIATGIMPTNDLEAAIVATLAPGSYTTVLRGNDGGTGRGSGDLHDLSSAKVMEVTAVGTRGKVGTDKDVLTSGILIQQSGDILIRVLGPSLNGAGISGALPDPMIELRDGNGLLVLFNDDWQDSQEAAIEATGLAPSGILESAMVASLPEGQYTTVIQGFNGATGVGYVQFYTLPHSGPELKLTP